MHSRVHMHIWAHTGNIFDVGVKWPIPGIGVRKVLLVPLMGFSILKTPIKMKGRPISANPVVYPINGQKGLEMGLYAYIGALRMFHVQRCRITHMQARTY